MKRLLLLVALALPSLGLYSCVTRVKVPTATTIIQEAHEAFPMPELPPTVLIPVPAEEFERANPTPTQPKPKVKKHVPAARPVTRPAPRPVPRPRPPVGQAEVEPLPPQEGVICIFPLNMIPTCTPEPAGRMP
jgi:hypothetical protein